MKCPSCGQGELDYVGLGDREFVAGMMCPRCRGCWLPPEQLDRVEFGVWSNIDELRLSAAQALSDLLCPRCAIQMVTLNPDDHAELAVDRCPSCHGLWLDNGELDSLYDIAAEHVAEHGGLHRRPDGWSLVRWLAYRVAQEWKHLRDG